MIENVKVTWWNQEKFNYINFVLDWLFANASVSLISDLPSIKDQYTWKCPLLFVV